jgi:hypothetical protein
MRENQRLLSDALLALPQPIVLTLTETALVGGGADGGVRPPACECHPDRSGNLVCKDANGRTCG